MTRMNEVVTINEMTLTLERYKDGKLSNAETLKKLIILFEELQGPEKSAQKQQDEKTMTQMLAEGMKDFFLNPERNKGKFGGRYR